MIKLISLFLFLLFTGSAQIEYDILIKNGQVLDGTGNPWYKADIAIIDNQIVAMGNLKDASANRVIDASGLYVSPGFIDTHSHAASGLIAEELSVGRPLLAQGITTVIVNPDGSGAVDLINQQNRLMEYGLGVNVAQMVPHSSIRREVVGLGDRAPTNTELREMKRLAEDGMKAGAVGMSTGLFYAPASYSETSEIVELAKVVHQYNGIHQSHIRDESDYSIGVVNAVKEIIEISEQSGIIGIVSHIKALGPNVWGKSQEIVDLINEARDQKGLQIFADQYPYDASATGLMAALVPRWATDGGRSAFLERLQNSETRSRIVADMEENLARRGGADRIVMRHVSFDSSLEGISLAEIADNKGTNAVEAALELLSQGGPGIVSFNMHADDIERFMKQPWTMTASDGAFVSKGDGVPHPRNYGSFPRRIKTYTVEQQITDLSTAIRSMTSLPATVYRIPNRGLLRPGMEADIAIFDLNQLQDKATFTDPHQLSEGMIYVLVNGQIAIDKAQQLGTLNGKILKRADS
jgi:N-acyl-D-amino-acid deacylase